MIWGPPKEWVLQEECVAITHDRKMGDKAILAGSLLIIGSLLLFAFFIKLGFDEGKILSREIKLGQSLEVLRDSREVLDRLYADAGPSNSTGPGVREKAVRFRRQLSALFQDPIAWTGLEPEDQSYFRGLAQRLDTGVLTLEPSLYREGVNILQHRTRILEGRIRDGRQDYDLAENFRIGIGALTFFLASGGILGMMLAVRRVRKVSARVTDVLNGAGVPLFLKDRKGRWVWANRVGLRLFGFDRKPSSLWREKDFSTTPVLREDETLERFQKNDEEAFKRGDFTRNMEVFSRQGGSPRHFDFVRIPLADEEGVPIGLLVTGQEVSMQIIRSLHLALSRINELITRVPDPETLFGEISRIVMEFGRVQACLIGEIDPETRNLTWVEVRGISLEAAAPLKFSSDPFMPEGSGFVGSVLRSGRYLTARLHRNEYPLYKKPGEENHNSFINVGAFPIYRGERIIGLLLVHDPLAGGFDAEMTDFLIQVSRNLSFGLDNWDRDHRKKSEEEKIVFMAFHDPLTALPNRRLFLDRINQARERSLRGIEHFAVGVLDLDGFKAVNDCWGHQMGDKLLVEVSGRLKRTLRGADTLARLGGDEFGFVFADLASSSLEQITRRILEIFSQPFEVGGRSLVVGGSLGLTLCPPDDGDANTLIAHADKAMYQVKSSTKNSWKVYAPL